MTLQFQSQRFAGDAVLEDILNDADTGTKKLQSGSPAGSVTSVQTAMWDLFHWFVPIPPVVNRSTFIDGVYGDSTEATVENYKRHYDIHFPPDQPTGSYDGFTGPRTLRALDQHCVLLDEAVDAIETKANALAASGLNVQLFTDQSEGRETVPILGTPGAFRGVDIDGTIGEINFKRGLGAFEVHGAIFLEWARRGLAKGPLGFPISDEHDDGPGFRRSDFEHGSLRCDLGTGDVTVIGDPPDPEALF